MTAVNYINASMEVWGCVICGIVAVCLLVERRRPNQEDTLYFRILGCNAGALLADVLALFFRGRVDTLSWWGVRIANFCGFMMNFLLLASFLQYITVYLGKHAAVPRLPLQIVRGACAAMLAMLVLNLFVPVFYSFDANNVYHRAPLFWVSHGYGVLGMVLCAWILVRCRRALTDVREKVALWGYLVLPLLAMLVQMVDYGLALLNFADTVSIILVFLLLQAEQGRRVAEQENRLTQDRVAIMLSQIQPHFLYNALAAIQDMCHGKAPEAELATIEFAEFLRGNMNSLGAAAPIPFEKELHHTQNYLALEKARFGDKLVVQYEILDKDFSIPALTLQPIVENAVRYGVMQREAGGTVKIRVEKTAGAHCVTVEDDGVGFDPLAPKADGRTHIGIANVAGRLRSMCGGSLSIYSVPDKGTVATITIPGRDQVG